MSAIDIIAIKQRDGSIKISPFYIRFKHKSPKKSIVEVYLNEELVENKTTCNLIVPAGDTLAIFENLCISTGESEPRLIL